MRAAETLVSPGPRSSSIDCAESPDGRNLPTVPHAPGACRAGSIDSPRPTIVMLALQPSVGSHRPMARTLEPLPGAHADAGCPVRDRARDRAGAGARRDLDRQHARDIFLTFTPCDSPRPSRSTVC